MKKLIQWLIPAVVIICVICLFFVSGAGSMLELDREMVLRGEWWRVVTGHFVHCSRNHLFWDTAAFAALSVAGVRRDFKGFVQTAIVAVPIISISVLLFCPEIEVYRGLSGLDTALYAYLVLSLLNDATRDGNRISIVLYGLLLAGLIGKNIWEVSSGNVLFCDPEGYVPVPAAHLAGLFTGFAVFFWSFGRDSVVYLVMMAKGL